MTEFTEKVYAAVRRVPRGKVITYKSVAAQAGNPKAARAVGRIMANNPYPFGSKASRQDLVPCHRVVQSNGEIGGFMGGYRHCREKQELLCREGIKVNEQKIIDFKQYLFVEKE